LNVPDRVRPLAPEVNSRSPGHNLPTAASFPQVPGDRELLEQFDQLLRRRARHEKADVMSRPRSLDPGGLAALRREVSAIIDDRGVPASQLALAINGEIVMHETFGEASDTTRFAAFSVTKPFVSAVVWQLLDEGLLRLDTRPADVIPEFATHGKDEITLEQVLTHTAGFPSARLEVEDAATSVGRRQAFSRWKLDWAPGTRFEYHALSAHWVLAELIHSVTGEDHCDSLERRIRVPLGLSRRLLGLDLDDQEDIAPLTLVGAPIESDGAITVNDLLRVVDPEACKLGIPGAGGVMTAGDVALFYQGLLHNPGQLWSPVMLQDATANARNTFIDDYSGVPANRTIGVCVAGSDGFAARRGFGARTSPRTFGHGGAGGQVAWADPDNGISFCYLTSGLEQNFALLEEHENALSDLAAACVRV
jgi:CubicO group peptidase (beta-lactamase class C family)